MNNYPILICGSGNSIPFLNSRYFNNHFRHGLDSQLEEIIKGNFSIGLNYWFKYGCDTTFISFADYQFYEDNYEALKSLPLIIGSNDLCLKNKNEDKTHKNTILLENSGIYNGKDSISKGVYSKQLIGIWSLSLAIALGFKEIYLLGFDANEINGQTHFYQGVVDLKKSTPIYIKDKHVIDRLHFRGIGKNEKGDYKTSTYNIKKHLNYKWFAPFTKEKDVQIYNVSLESAIEVFPRISYEQFYTQVKNNCVFQDQARAYITEQIYGQLK